jgi:magnesium transporter
MPMDVMTPRHTEPGTAPGTLEGRAPAGREALHFTLVEYSAEKAEVFTEVEIDECHAHLTAPGLTWIDVSGRASAEMLKYLGDAFNLHPLALEDVFHGSQRAKFDVYDKDLTDRQGFLVLSDPRIEGGELKVRQVSIFFGVDYAISFHDADEDIFRAVRERIQSASSRLRKNGIDYLVYALADLVVDRKFPVVAKLGDTVEELEDEVLERPTRETLKRIHETRRALISAHKVAWAEREAVLALMRPDAPHMTADTRTYLKDVFDHAAGVLELVESYREMTNGVMDVYLMDTSNRTNEVVKVLAIFTAFFMPLTFLVGVYGMNFDREVGNMPELGWRYGYVFFWCLVAAIGGGLFWWFRRRGWL